MRPVINCHDNDNTTPEHESESGDPQAGLVRSPDALAGGILQAECEYACNDAEEPGNSLPQSPSLVKNWLHNPSVTGNGVFDMRKPQNNRSDE